MSYLKLSTMKYPVQEGDIRLEHSEITENQTGDTFPVLADYVKVENTDVPEFNRETHQLKLGIPIQKDGVWYQVWTVQPLTQAQIDKRNYMREYRRNNPAALMPPNFAQPNLNVDGNPPDVI